MFTIEGEEKDQRQRKKQRQQSKKNRGPRVSNDNGSRRGWLGYLTEGILPDDGLCIGRSGTVPCGQQGNRWKVNGSLHSQQNVVDNYGVMISSPSGRWLWWHLHEDRSKILFCHSRPSQPCHGDIIVGVFAEDMAEKKHRGGAPPRLDGLSLCGVGWALESHLCLSPR